MKRVDLRYAAKLNLLWIAMTGLFDEPAWREAVRAFGYFIATRGACSGILDLSRIERLDVSPALARDIAETKAGFPAGWLRGVIASDLAGNDISRLIQALRSSSKATLLLCRSGDETLRRLGVATASFDAVDLSARDDSPD